MKQAAGFPGGCGPGGETRLPGRTAPHREVSGTAGRCNAANPAAGYAEIKQISADTRR